MLGQCSTLFGCSTNLQTLSKLIDGPAPTHHCHTATFFDPDVSQLHIWKQSSWQWVALVPQLSAPLAWVVSYFCDASLCSKERDRAYGIAFKAILPQLSQGAVVQQGLLKPVITV